MRLLLPALLATSLHAQNGTAASALQHLQRILSSQKPVIWVQTPANSPKSADTTHVNASLTDVQVDPGACVLSFKDGRNFPDQKYETVQTWKVSLPHIDRIQVESLEGFVERLRAEGGQPRWDTKTEPAVFVLEIGAATDRKFHVHRWSRNRDNEVIERDLDQALVFLVFATEATAREAAAAVRSAKDRCKRNQ